MHPQCIPFVKVQLTQGKVALISPEDGGRVLARKWHAIWTGHAWYAASGWGGKRLYLHRFLMDAQRGRYVDHKNGNGLDNRRGNLRDCSQSQNMANMAKWKVGPSGFRGVFFDHRGRKKPWSASLTCAGKKQYLGCYQTAEEAAHAYDNAARKVFGEFARTNFS